MSIRQFLLALRARIGVFALVLALTVVVTGVVSLLMPRTYSATVSLLVDAKDEQSLTSAGQPVAFAMPQERLSYLQTQADIINSRKVALQVAHNLGLAQSPAVQEAYAKAAKGNGTIDDWLVEGLLKRLKVNTTQSNVIQITNSASDAGEAARISNAFARAYMDTMVELRTTPTREAAAWFDEQLKSLRANLESAQAKLTEYLQKQRLLVDDKNDVDSVRMNVLAEQALRAQEQSIQWSSRQQQARRVLDQGVSPDRMPEVLENQAVQRLKAELSAGEAKLRELATQYGSNHPQYQRQVSQNQGLRERLNAEMRTVVSGIESSARQSRQREADLTAALAAQRAKLLGQRDNRDEIAVLRHNVDSADKAYDAALQRAAITQVEGRARRTNVVVLNPAVAPARHSSPHVTFNIALALAVGAMLGIGVVLLMEMFDRRVRSHDDLDYAWDVPLLVVLDPWQPPERLRLPAPASYGKALPSPG